MLGRAGMPEAEMATLEKQLLAIVATDEARSKLHKQDIVVPKGRTEFKASIAHDAVVNRELIKAAGVQLD